MAILFNIEEDALFQEGYEKGLKRAVVNLILDETLRIDKIAEVMKLPLEEVELIKGGLEEGIKEGREMARKQIVTSLLEDGEFSIERIAEITDTNEEEVKRIEQEIKQ